MKRLPDPKCNLCGAEITTALMAVFCPRNDCEFMPTEGLPPEFQAWRDQELSDKSGDGI